MIDDHELAVAILPADKTDLTACACKYGCAPRRFDVLAEYKFTQNFSATANVLNIFNETYYDALYQSDGANAFVAPGRVGYLTLNWKY